MLERREIGLEGTWELQPRVHTDPRGRFLKILQASAFRRLGLRSDFVEHYVSTSRRDVLRGLHFQVPPEQHAKLVTCLHGRAFDAVVDLRVGSPTYLQHAHVILDAALGNLIYVPPGVAHGFWTLSEEALMSYHVTSEHAPAQDAGISWSSAGIPWPGVRPLLSERDAAFPALADLRSPFTYEPAT